MNVPIVLNQNEMLDFMIYTDSLMKREEAFDLEFKLAQNGLPNSLWDTYSAFANTQGGVIVLGVREKNNRFLVEGLTSGQIAQYKKDFWNQVNNPDCVNLNLLTDQNLYEGEYKGKKLLLIYVPRAPRTLRPVFRTHNPFDGHTFKRNNEGDYKCTNQEIRRMIADADDSHPRDSRILAHYSMEDIDPDSLRLYRQIFTSRQPVHPWLELDDLQLLKVLGGYRKDRQTGEEGFTLAGLLMFGKTESIMDIECAPNYFPDFQEHLFADQDIRWTDRIYPDGTWEANLFQFYRRVYPRLITTLPKPFSVEGSVRQEDTPTHIALREAFVNALIHCDFVEEGHIVIEQWPHRFKFRNPGTLLVSRMQYYQGGESVCRNKALQKMFTMLGFAERAGSGVSKIMKGWEAANWAKPYVEEYSCPDRVELILPKISLFPDEVKVKMIDLFGEKITGLEHDQLLVLATCYSEGLINNERLQHLLHLHPSDITKLLKTLCRQHYLISEGSGRGTKYKVNMETSEINMGTSDANMETSLSRQRLKFEELEQIIVAVAQEYMGIDQIALKIGRTSQYLMNFIIPRMLRNGSLERLYPDIPNHPLQKYKARQNLQKK